ncbi:TRM11 family SAM-dependent methyltransferase [Sediminitomix flava]|uniref:Methyltransferase family protein n=1 Tax=Sediminitomix flava TaxID=379075 RepID=A0A315Z7Q0_SEDFL|nr:methyltransferase [Sediminitomix flava]PWJ40071.1 methyltransferase family protein [Sediminitomix flava]
MSGQGYIYSFKYDYHHTSLCKLESRQIFQKEEEDKVLFSDVKIDPAISPFILSRFDVILSTENYEDLIQDIKALNLTDHGFKVDYLKLTGDNTRFAERKLKLKDVGYSIFAEPNFFTPSITYSICTYKGIWYFGTLEKRQTDWVKHNDKPYSFSNSICMIIGKSLVSMVSKGDKSQKLLDVCCGVGTIMLEACYSGFNIEGCDINPKRWNHTTLNLEHYNYKAKVHCSDVKDMTDRYDSAIIDLPYNLYSYSTDFITKNIIESTAKLSDRVVIVSTTNVREIISNAGLSIIDHCTVEKKGKSTFARNIWVCEK